MGVLLLSVLLGKGYGGSVDDGGRAVCVTMADFFADDEAGGVFYCRPSPVKTKPPNQFFRVSNFCRRGG